MTKYYLKPEELKPHEDKMRGILEEKGYDESQVEMKLNNHFKNYVIPLYTKDWMDEQLNYWIHIILEVPGGYWIAQDIANQPHVEFEHYRLKNSMSYEKANVGNETAKRELTKKSYKEYKKGKELKPKIVEYSLHMEYSVPKHL